MRPVSTRHLLTTALLTSLAACSAKQPEAVTPPSAPTSSATNAAVPLLPEAERVVLDSANDLYRAKNYAGALAAYRRATTIAPGDAAPWYGIYMVATVTGAKAMGDSALAAMQARGAATGQPADAEVQAAHKSGKISPTAH